MLGKVKCAIWKGNELLTLRDRGKPRRTLMDGKREKLEVKVCAVCLVAKAHLGLERARGTLGERKVLGDYQMQGGADGESINGGKKVKLQNLRSKVGTESSKIEEFRVKNEGRDLGQVKKGKGAVQARSDKGTGDVREPAGAFGGTGTANLEKE